MSGEFYFSADQHFNHPLVAELRGFSSVAEHDEAILDALMYTIKPGDNTFFLGDVQLPFQQEAFSKILQKIPGQKHLVLGNHDPTKKHQGMVGRKDGQWQWVGHIRARKIDATPFFLCHYACRSWPGMGRGVIHLYGHCFDLDTEVLTREGWKLRSEISLEDEVATIAYPSDVVEYQRPSEIVDVEWTGDVYHIQNRNFNGRLTPEHVMILARTGGDGGLYKEYAADFQNQTNRKVLCAGKSGNSEFPLDDDVLRLYVWMVTDGSAEARRVGFHFKKERKIKRLRLLLDQLGLDYSVHPQKHGTVKIRTEIPTVLQLIGFKPLHPFVLELSQRQAEVFIEEYTHTDGCRTSKNSIQISTSKPSEAHLLQQFLVTHGYRCNISERREGNWVISTNSTATSWTTVAPGLVEREQVVDESFWCLRVPNQTLIIRRHGKVHVTGNSHGNLAPDYGKSMDVGVDTRSDWAPWHIDEVRELMDKTPVLVVDHHDVDEWLGDDSPFE